MTATKLAVARVAREVACGVPGVAGLYAGVLGEFSTYGDGERIRGVQVRSGENAAIEEVEVRVTLDFDHLVASSFDTVQQLGARVQVAVYDAVAVAVSRPLRVHIRVADVVRTGQGAG